MWNVERKTKMTRHINYTVQMHLCLLASTLGHQSSCAWSNLACLLTKSSMQLCKQTSSCWHSVLDSNRDKLTVVHLHTHFTFSRDNAGHKTWNCLFFTGELRICFPCTVCVVWILSPKHPPKRVFFVIKKSPKGFFMTKHTSFPETELQFSLNSAGFWHPEATSHGGNCTHQRVYDQCGSSCAPSS